MTPAGYMRRNTAPGVIGDDSEAAYGYCRCVPSLVSMRRMRMGQAIVVWLTPHSRAEKASSRGRHGMCSKTSGTRERACCEVASLEQRIR